MASTKKTPAAKPAVKENNSASSDEDLKAMLAQVAFQFAQLQKLAEKQNIKLTDVFETPPSATTVEQEPKPAATESTELGQPVIAEPTQTGRPKPGTVLPGGNWVPWNPMDLKDSKKITFTPLPIPTLVFPFPDENGFAKIRLDVNDLVCWLTCGIPNTVSEMFYWAYKNGEDQWRALENLKRNGPAYAPWGQRGPDGGQAWQFTPMAASFGMDIDGRSLRRGGPTPLDPRPNELTEPAPVTVAPSAEGEGA